MSKFWLDRWETGQIGWHRADVHPNLMAQHERLLATSGAVLVPLCGKTRDVAWLAEKTDVIGVELSPIATAELFEEAGLTPTRDTHGPYERWRAGRITILVGDFFALTPEWTGPVSGIWDRAAMVAIQPNRREAYVTVLRAVCSGTLLLNALAYDQSISDGPPFSVSAQHVDALFASSELLDDVDVLDDRWRSKGHTSVRSQVYAIGLT
ncbi:MAG: thiopurine S-methyltransferase [Proteobacteria bacterium]|nr:thiopurine S-methyltransferase [Pseudomonadota bacterium]